MDDAEKISEVEGWLYLNEPPDGGWPHYGDWFGDLLIVAEHDFESDEPEGISIYRRADLIAFYDRVAAMAEKHGSKDLYEFYWDVEQPPTVSAIEEGAT